MSHGQHLNLKFKEVTIGETVTSRGSEFMISVDFLRLHPSCFVDPILYI